MRGKNSSFSFTQCYSMPPRNYRNFEIIAWIYDGILLWWVSESNWLISNVRFNVLLLFLINDNNCTICILMQYAGTLSYRCNWWTNRITREVCENNTKPFLLNSFYNLTRVVCKLALDLVKIKIRTSLNLYENGMMMIGDIGHRSRKFDSWINNMTSPGI